MAGRLIQVVVACLVVVPKSSQDLISPCPEFFEYETNENERNKWYGNVTLYSNRTLDGVWLRLLFNSAPLHVEFQNQFGEINSYNNVSYILKNVDYKLEANTRLMLRFYVQYDTSKPVPLLIGIRLNAETICAAEKVDNRSDPVVNKVRNEITTVSKGCPLQTESPSHEIFLNTNDICGRPSLTEQKTSMPEKGSAGGKWPWVVGIYTNIRGSLHYTCVGSLISQNFIVTCGYCVFEITGEVLEPNMISAFLGTASLKDFSDDLQVATISQIIIHPEYAEVNYDNNIAILKTRKPVEYTFFVKPVCLWDGDDNISRLYEKKGKSISWASTEYGKLSETLEQYELVIINNTRCSDVIPEDFKNYIHPRGFCAGAENGSRAFDGDIGSGLVIKESNVNGEKLWYLRGLSSACPQNTKNRCHPNYYSFFLDAAKYVPWIKEKVKNI